MNKVISYFFANINFEQFVCVGPGHLNPIGSRASSFQFFDKNDHCLSFIDIVSPRNRNVVLNSIIDEQRRTIVFSDGCLFQIRIIFPDPISNWSELNQAINYIRINY